MNEQSLEVFLHYHLPIRQRSSLLPRCGAVAAMDHLRLYPLEHHNVPFRGITFPEIADVLPPILLIQGFFNPPRMANEHTH